MIIKNVKAYWLFINRPDENGKYRLTFDVTKEQFDVLYESTLKVAEANGVKIEDLAWYMGYKQNEITGQRSVSCKASHTFTSKQGEEITFTLPVYNKKAVKFDPEAVPLVANGAIINVEVDPYFVKYKGKKGIMLGLRSVQLLDYEEYNANPYQDESGENPYGDENPYGGSTNNPPKTSGPSIDVDEDDIF